MRKPFVCGNWKMYKTATEARALARELANGMRGAGMAADVAVCPAFPALPAVAEALKDSPIAWGSQNCSAFPEGAFTGEVAVSMLVDLGCRFAILGHSERRHVFGETDFLINRRITGALLHGIIPIFCIGETLKQRESEQTMKVLEDQVKAGLAGVELHDGSQLVVAYEPVWAIGTGKTATEEQAQEAHVFIRTLLEGMFEKNIAGQIRILYGGSVKSENVDILMSQPDIDGALVGGAALKAESFERIICFQ